MLLRNYSISVIVPTFNGIENLSYVFTSIERQTKIKNIIQIIIVDDGSIVPEKHERYERLLHKYPRLPIEIIYLEVNKGPATARNAGIKQAKGDIVFFTDDDCDLPANSLELHLDVYLKKPYVSGVGGWYQSLSHVVERNIFERFVFIKYLAIFGWTMYQSESISSEYHSRRNLFMASNTANLSVKRYVLDDVVFDEDFIAPGLEDIFFSEEIRKKGYLLQYIPLLVTHRKHLTKKKFLKFCYNRGMGMFVHRKKYGVKPRMGLYKELKWLNRRLLQLSKENPLLGRYRYRLLSLEVIRKFYLSSVFMDWYYSLKYFFKRGYLPGQKYNT